MKIGAFFVQQIHVSGVIIYSMERQSVFGCRCLVVISIAVLFSSNISAQQMFTYKDAKGKILSQAQVDSLDKQYGGFLIIEFLSDDPLIVQVIFPNPQELKAIRELRETETAELKKKWLGKTLPPFNFESLAKKKYGSDQLLGKKTVIFFWSRNDYGSLNQLQAMNDLVRSNQDKEVQFLAVTFEDAVLVKEFLKKHPMNMEILPNNFEWVMQDLAIMQTPVVMIVAPDGKVCFISTSSQRDIDRIIKAELTKSSQ